MIFTISLLLRSLYLTFAPLVTLVKSYVFTKLDVSAAFLSRENRTHGTDERGVTLNAAHRKGVT